MEQVVQPQFHVSAAAVLVAVLALVGLGIIVQVIVRERERAVSLRALAGRLGSLLCAVPVIAALAVLALRAAPHLQDGEVPEPLLRQPVIDAADALPARVASWTREAPRASPQVSTAILSSPRYATVEQADEVVLAEAARRIKAEFHDVQPWKGEWRVPDDLVQAALRDRFVEDVQHTSGTSRFLMHRVHARLELSPELRERISESWRRQIAGRRLAILGGLAAVLMLVPATVTAYFHLDHLSHGTCRHRLKLAAVSLIVAGTVAAAALLP